jgi:hypothetical protein
MMDEAARLKLTSIYELYLQRRLNAAAADPKIALSVPQPLPTATEANSWLLYQDPLDRIYFQHPQNLKLSDRLEDPNSLELIDQEPETGRDVLVLELPPGRASAEADKEFRDIRQWERDIESYWLKNKATELLRGPSGWLPEADWAPWKVFRKELGVIAGGAQRGKPVDRIYFDYYFVLSKRNECFHVQTMTNRDDHVAFRTESEGIIKSFHFGKWDPQAKPPATEPPVPPITAPPAPTTTAPPAPTTTAPPAPTTTAPPTPPIRPSN